MQITFKEQKMENKEFINKIRDMIAEGETEQSLEELYHFVRDADNELLDALVMLRNRMRKLQQSASNGTIDEETLFQERARINESILMYLRQMTPEYIELNKKEIEKENFHIPRPEAPRAPAPMNLKPLYIGGGVLILLGLVYMLVFNNSGGNSKSSTTNVTPNSIAPNTVTPQNVYPKWAEVRTKFKDDLRIRSRPDENSDIVTNMPHGSRVKILGVDGQYVVLKSGDRGKWFKVEYDDGSGTLRFGWAWGNYLFFIE